MIKTVPINKVRPDPSNLRGDVGDVTELAASIAAVGLLQPLVVTAKGASYDLVFGHRRLAACKKNKMTEVDVDVRELDELTRLEVQIVENLQREDLRELDEARGYQRLLEMKLSQRDIAARVGRSQGQISKRLSLLALPAAAQKALDSGGINVVEALELTKLKEAGRVATALKEARSGWGTVERAVAHQLQEQEKATKRKAAVDELTAKGVKIIDAGRHFDSYGRRERSIGTGYNELRLDAKAHATQSCHAAAVDEHGRVTLVCTRPERHPEARRENGRGGPLTDKEKKDRADKRAHNKARREAQAARAQAMTALLLKRRLPKGDVFAHIVEQWVSLRATNHLPARIACGLLGIEAPRRKTTYGEVVDYQKPLLEMAAAGGRQLEQVGLALAFAVAEEPIRSDYPSWGGAEVGAHIGFLQTHGYTVADVEEKDLKAAGNQVRS